MNPAQPAGGPSRQNSPNLDILRAIAVLTVVVDHLIPTLRHRGWEIPHALSEWTLHIGHAGVLAFFVHTSLVLMYSLERIGHRGWGMAWRFYVRRALRIYPLALAVIVLVVLLAWPEAPWKNAHAPRHDRSTIVANLLLVQNLWTGHNLLTPLWSLPYEVEMYLVLPVLYLVARHVHGLRWISAALVTAIIGGWMLNKIQHGHMNLAAYVPCFLAGVLCYLLRDRIAPRISGRWWWLFVLAAVAAYCGAHTISDRLIYWMGWLYALIIGLAIPLFHDSPLHRLNRASEKVALYSYGIYLLHVPALHLVFEIWRPGERLLADRPLAVTYGIEVPIFLALTAVAAIAAYHLLEAPMVRLGRRLSG